MFVYMIHIAVSNENNHTEKLAKMNEEVSNEGLNPASKPLKEKTSKAERRALQEAQRAAKSAKKGQTLFHFLSFG